MPKISVYTLGCKLNFAETATILRDFLNHGYEQVPFGEPADVVIVNTCTVTTQADNKSKFAVKKALKTSPQAKVIVIGCSAQVSTQKYEHLPNVAMVVGADKKLDVYQLLHSKKISKIAKPDDVFAIKEFKPAYSLHLRTRSFLKIQDGCDYVCSYCIIPKARGRSRNAPIKELVKQAEKIAQNGIKEIILTGVNIGDFGKSTGESFLDLIKALDKIDNIKRIRISSIEPELLKDEIIEFIANSDKFMPHLHIPLQSGSDKILRLMQRRYNTRLFRERILKAYNTIADIFFGIDVIVGFPGETEQDFKQTYELLESLPIAYLHIFPYSDRPGTKASSLPNKVDTHTKHLRVHKLMELSKQKHKNFYKKYLNTYRKVLFERTIKEGLIYGFTDNYIRVALPYDKRLTNEIIKVFLEKYDEQRQVILAKLK